CCKVARSAQVTFGYKYSSYDINQVFSYIQFALHSQTFNKTNAPTRYLVKPNSGVLADDTAVKVEIQLHGNRYNPKHKLILQAVEIFSKDEAKSVSKGRTWEICVSRPVYVTNSSTCDTSCPVPSGAFAMDDMKMLYRPALLPQYRSGRSANEAHRFQQTARTRHLQCST
ncbi:unnamed protein product, partial [Heligmosomoides polygyrus]|uniref:MSP domain-containing protein n=1 Tax=Heligmosomoides polygyrus TaxID=6339 RepID=A0A183G8M1_HELPZ